VYFNVHPKKQQYMYFDPRMSFDVKSDHAEQMERRVSRQDSD